jgi:hypothetical protein
MANGRSLPIGSPLSVMGSIVITCVQRLAPVASFSRRSSGRVRTEGKGKPNGLENQSSPGNSSSPAVWKSSTPEKGPHPVSSRDETAPPASGRNLPYDSQMASGASMSRTIHPS